MLVHWLLREERLEDHFSCPEEVSLVVNFADPVEWVEMVDYSSKKS